MTLEHIRVNLPTGVFYKFLPEMSIKSFESLNLGDVAYTYQHVRARLSHCWGCGDPIWEGQNTISYQFSSMRYFLFHAPCYWDFQSSSEFETNLYKPRYLVVVYDCDREMGGPEEGGWSYEVGELVTSIAVDDKDAADLIREGLSIEYPYTGQRGYYSKREPDFSVYIIDRHEGHEYLDERQEPIAHYPLQVPYYC